MFTRNSQDDVASYAEDAASSVLSFDRTAKGYVAGLNQRMSQNILGRSIQMGTMETFGWHFEGGRNLGFLGLRAERANLSTFAKQMKSGGSGAARGAAGIAGRTALRAIGGFATGVFAYQGYKEGGVFGAMKGVAESAAYNIAFKYAGAVVGSTALWATAGLAAAGIGAYYLGEAGKKYGKGLRNLEMGGGQEVQRTIQSAGVATARQRAMMALNNTHLNGRMALGNEGFLLHRGFGS